jgi:hypothetical protein
VLLNTVVIAHLTFAAAAPSPELESVKAQLLNGDSLTALSIAEKALGQYPDDPDLNAVTASVLQDVDPARAAQLRAKGGSAPVPLPTVPSNDPAVAKQVAWVNVASAAVRASASEKAKLSLRLPIGSRVRVEKLGKDFAQVTFPHPDTDRPVRGFIHRSLLSPKQPTVDGLLEEAKRQKTSGADFELALLWRALNLAANRNDLYQAVLDAAFATRRYDVAVDALKVAIRGRQWPPPKEVYFPSAEALRLHLWRAAQATWGEGLARGIPFVKRFVMGTQEGGLVPAGSMWDRRPESPLWPALKAVLLSPVDRTERSWVFEKDDQWLELSDRGRGPAGLWSVTVFELPGWRPMPDEHEGSWFEWHQHLKDLRKPGGVRTRSSNEGG